MTLPDKDDLDTLGGEMSNYGAVVDPTTDLDAAFHNVAMADIAGMTRTAIRAACRFTGHGTTPTDPASGFVHDSVWGSAPAVKPVVTRDSSGVFDVEWPATVTDELGETHSVNILFADAWVEISGTLYHAKAVPTAANIVRVYCFNAGGTANDVVGLNVVVLAW